MNRGELSAEALAPIRAGFFQECEELLADLEAGLLALQDGGGGAADVDRVFRAVHSIKGGAGAFGLRGLIGFAHAFETAMDRVRSMRPPVDPDLVRTLLAAADVLADLVRASRDGADDDIDALLANAASLTATLGALAPSSVAAALDDDGFLDFTPAPLALAIEAPERTWTVRLRPRRELYATANDPLILLRELGRLGRASVRLDRSALPALDALDPEESYLAWEAQLVSSADETQIREVFAFVEGDCDLEIAEASAVGEPAAPALAPPAEPRPADRAGDSPTIRVDLERVDRLVDLVGEIVINQSVLAQRIAEAGPETAGALDEPLQDLAQLIRDLQEGVMAIRAQPVKVVFQRLSRVVREVEELTGKKVKLATSGEDTEVDRTVIERLTDPLTHMVRNAVDHGIESPDQRLAAGKPAEGLLRVGASHRGGRVLIEVSDDGVGIDRASVRRTAIERGLIAPDASLTDEELDNLIFAPGFSTSNAVTAVSGRGVGMDVVRSGVQALGGRVSVASQAGRGASFVLSMPLTLAVLDGMVVSVAGHRFVAPLSGLVESVRPTAASVRELGRQERLLRFRGEYLALIDLGSALGCRSEPLRPDAGVALVVEDDAGGRAALWVDEIVGQRQVVIKSLEANYRAVPGVAGATILGDGRVALILDLAAVVASNRSQLRVAV